MQLAQSLKEDPSNLFPNRENEFSGAVFALEFGDPSSHRTKDPSTASPQGN